MGLILDSSLLVAAERQGKNARQMLADIAREVGETEVAISVVTLIELAHGAARAGTAERKAKRQQFTQELVTALPIHSVTAPVALRAGQIDGENQARGIRIPVSAWPRPTSGTSGRCLGCQWCNCSRAWRIPTHRERCITQFVICTSRSQRV